MTAQCSKCKRDFTCSELYKKAVEAGKIEPVCGSCDGSNAIDETEYKYGDR